MRFKYFLNESERHGRGVDDSEIARVFIRKMNHEVIHNLLEEKEDFVYRGVSTPLGAVHIKNSVNLEKPRRSANTTNEFTVLTSRMLPSWKYYPEREQSFICTTDREYAKDYGDVYVVFPFYDPDFGVCPKNDIWNSFKTHELLKVGDAAPRLNRALQFLNEFTDKNPDIKSIRDIRIDFRLKEVLDKIEKGILDKSITEKRIIEVFDSQLKGYITSTPYRGFMIDVVNATIKNGSIIKTLDELLDPDKNDFQLLKFDEVIKLANSDREVWFKGEALFVQERYLGELRKNIREYKNENK